MQNLKFKSCRNFRFLTSIFDFSLLTFNFQRKPNGFTLIELLVVIGIVSTVFTVGFASYRDFERRQQLTQAANTLKQDLLLAQQKALAAEKPSGCTGDLLGYRVSLGGTSYEIFADCVTGDVSVKTVTLPPVVTKSAGSSSLTFKVLAMGTTSTTDEIITLRHTSTNQTVLITITTTGLIAIGTLTTQAQVPSPTLTPISTPTPAPAPTCTNGYQDFDKDGYGTGALGCYASSPSYDVVQNNSDCYDNNPNARPGQTGYFVTQRGDGSFDYDCDGVGAKKCTYQGGGSGGCADCGEVCATGWFGSVPNCGASGEYVYQLFEYTNSCTGVSPGFTSADDYCTGQITSGKKKVQKISTTKTMECR